MRIAVIGAGVVGVTTAYELAADGHESVVFERRQSVAEEASFANAGLIAPGLIAPWTASGRAARMPSASLMRHAVLGMRSGMDPRTWSWLWQGWLASKPAAYQHHRHTMHALAVLSQQRLHELRLRHRLAYERSEGVLVLLRQERDVARVLPELERLQALGVAARLLEPAQCREREPDLHPDTALAGGLEVAGDEVGNCRQFVHLLREEAQRLGARFRFGTEVLGIEPGARPLLRLADRTSPHPRPASAQSISSADSRDAFDAVVVCAATFSLALLQPLKIRLPLLPVHGYTLSARLRDPDRAPRSAVRDERHGVVIARHGQRLRVSGGMELGGHPERHMPAALDTLYKVLQDWYPGTAHLQQAQVWKGASAMLADGPPVIGASRAPGVWLNLGHGAHGWALACGSARLLADQLGQRPPAIDAAPFSPSRYPPR